MKKKLLLFVILVSLCGTRTCAQASDIYITPSGSGSGVCTSGVQNPAFFNNSANWGNGNAQIGPGTTVHLCGVFTGGVNTTMLTVQGDGTSAHPITILFEAGTKLTSPAWSGYGGGGSIDLRGRSFITVNGDANGGRQGIIENTANGTVLANQNASNGIDASGSTNVVIKNLTIQNLYVHTSVSDCILGSGGIHGSGGAGNVNAVRGDPSTNLHVTNVLANYTGWAFDVYGTGTEIDHSDISNMDHGAAFGGPSSGQKFHDNHVHDMRVWDTTANCYHHDGLHSFSDNGHVDGLQIYNNVFDGDMGVNVTAQIYIEGDNGGESNVLIFNNVLLDSSTGTNGHNLLYLVTNGGKVTGAGIYNNFIYGSSTRNAGTGMGFQSVTGLSVKNNIVSGSQTDAGTSYSTIGGPGWDNNVYYDLNSDYGDNNVVGWNSDLTASLSRWRADCNCDTNAVLATATQINANTSTGLLNIGSVAINAGANLSSLGIPALSRDMNGVLRPNTGSWTAGTYTTGTTSHVPSPPTGISAVVH
jgi:hypothetical protein